MRVLLQVLTNPIVFGLSGALLFVLTRYHYTQYETGAGALFLVWAIAIGINHAVGHEDDSNRSARL